MPTTHSTCPQLPLRHGGPARDGHVKFNASRYTTRGDTVGVVRLGPGVDGVDVRPAGTHSNILFLLLRPAASHRPRGPGLRSG